MRRPPQTTSSKAGIHCIWCWRYVADAERIAADSRHETILDACSPRAADLLSSHHHTHFDTWEAFSERHKSDWNLDRGRALKVHRRTSADMWLLFEQDDTPRARRRGEGSYLQMAYTAGAIQSDQIVDRISLTRPYISTSQTWKIENMWHYKNSYIKTANQSTSRPCHVTSLQDEPSSLART